jgi:hypothetical protein
MKPKTKNIALANSVDAVHPNGNGTYTAGADIAQGQPLKFGADDRTVVPTTAATDIAIGIALDRALAGEPVPAALLGTFTGTVLLNASGAVSAGDQLNALGATAAAGDIVIGRALATASADEPVEIAHQVAAKMTA